MLFLRHAPVRPWVLIIVVAAAIGVSAQTHDLVSGTWELNVAKSKLSPGPLPKSETRTYEVTGQQLKSVQRGVDGYEKPTLVEYTANYDGNDYPYIGSPAYDSLSLRRVDDLTVAFTQKRGGKVALTGTRVISKDGKTMTVAGKGTDPQGRPLEVLLIFEKR